MMCSHFFIFFRPSGYIYPALLTALVPFRSYVLERLFKKEDMDHLDPTDESEEEAAAEQRAIHHALRERSESLESEEAMHIPNRADFHPRGMKKAIHEHEKLHAHPDGEVTDIIVQSDAKESTTDPLPVDPESIEISESGVWRGTMKSHQHDN